MAFGDLDTKKKDWDLINWFNSAACLCLSQVRTYIILASVTLISVVYG